MSSSTRRSGTAALALSVALTLSGCGSDQSTDAGNASSPVSAGPSTEPSPSPASASEVFGQVEPFTGPAAAKFGAENVMTAYEHLVSFHNENGYVPTLMKPRASRSEFKAAEFAFLRPYLTESARASFDTKLAAALGGSGNRGADGGGDAIGSIQALTLFDVGGETNGPTYAVFDDQPTLGAHVRDVSASVDKERLVIEFTYTKDLRLMHEGKKILQPYVKETSWAVVPNDDPEIPWLIDFYRAEVSLGEATPLPQ